MSGDIPLRSITSVAAISLLALASFGTVLVFEIQVTADEALQHADNVSDPGEIYLWKCPTSDGSSYTNERLELDTQPTTRVTFSVYPRCSFPFQSFSSILKTPA